MASNAYCVVILLCLSLSCVPYVASFSGFSILIAPSVFSNVYIIFMNTRWEHLGLPLCFSRVRVENRFSFLCCVFVLVYLRSVELCPMFSMSLECPYLMALSFYLQVWSVFLVGCAHKNIIESNGTVTK